MIFDIDFVILAWNFLNHVVYPRRRSLALLRTEKLRINCFESVKMWNKIWNKIGGWSFLFSWFKIVLERTVRCSRIVQFFVKFDMFEVRFWAKMWCSEVFEVHSSCYVTRLVLEHTVWCSRTVQFFVMFDMFEVRFWAKMWCSECLMFGHSMFIVFVVQYFGVHSKTT